MGKRQRNRKARARRPAAEALPGIWLDSGGLCLILPGTEPSAATLEEMTLRYQENIRASSLWDDMVRQYGPAEAEQLLKGFRAEMP